MIPDEAVPANGMRKGMPLAWRAGCWWLVALRAWFRRICRKSRCVIRGLVSCLGFGELGGRVGAFRNIFKDSLRDEVARGIRHSL